MSPPRGADTAERRALANRVRADLRLHQEVLERIDVRLAAADAELRAAEAGRAPLERDWLLGLPDPELPPGVFPFPYRPPRALEAARQRCASAADARRLVAAERLAAAEQVDRRRGALRVLEAELATESPAPAGPSDP
jgi:hypothetical protein